jgi:hypothetical protein
MIKIGSVRTELTNSRQTITLDSYTGIFLTIRTDKFRQYLTKRFSKEINNTKLKFIFYFL